MFCRDQKWSKYLKERQDPKGTFPIVATISYYSFVAIEWILYVYI